ncbi:MAG: sugar phosphate nucleotidyltransferase [Candidatus Omnitrophota bacterium]
MGNFKCIVLAAGEGSRMKSSLPKVLQPVCGKPMIGYILKVVRKAGIKEIIVIVNTTVQGRQIKNFLGKNIKTVNQKRLLGTAHAVSQAKKILSNYRGNVLIVCGDTPLLKKKTVDDLIKQHMDTGASGTLLSAILNNPTGYGRIVRDSSDRIKEIVEERDASIYEKVIEEINTGVYCFKAKELLSALKEVKADNAKKEFYLTDVIKIFYRRGLKIESVTTEDTEEILGINTKNELAKAQDIIRSRILTRLMDNGVTILDPKSTFIDEEASIGGDTIIYPHVIMEGKSSIGKNCKIGSFCRLRDDCHIKDNVVVGSFVEMVRTSIGDNTKIKHQCYLGDVQIGDGVNIGAGTVVDNYDGKKKYKTIIEDNVLIGSGVILIAPIKIAKNTICKAGMVISKNKNMAGKTIVDMPAYGLHERTKRQIKRH